MKNSQSNPLVYGIVGAVAGGAFVWILATSVVNTNATGMMQMMGIRSQNSGGRTLSSSTLDQHFIEQMIPHHEDAITMANAALEKAKRPEVKKLAEAIIKAQADEITQMKGWYRDWFNADVPQGNTQMGMHGMMAQKNSMHMGMMGDTTDLDALSTSADFDKAFIEGMIPHHQMAVMMATMLESGTSRPEMKTLAQNIITAQNKEITEMRAWYKQWYE